MATNYLTEACISTVREVLVFWSPQSVSFDGLKIKTKPKLNGRVQIIDVFSLEIAVGYSHDPNGRLLLKSKPSIAEARSWSLAKAAQLIRNDARPNRWVALHMNNRAWGLFWAGGGLQLCRDQLAAKAQELDECTALAPINAEQILALVLNTKTSNSESSSPIPIPKPPLSHDLRIIGITSAIWMTALLFVIAGFHQAIEQQNQKLEILLQRIPPTQENK